MKLLLENLHQNLLPTLGPLHIVDKSLTRYSRCTQVDMYSYARSNADDGIQYWTREVSI